MISWVLDESTENDIYDLGTNSTTGAGLDHPVSGGANDPFMDWVYFRNPQNTSPGTAGYDQFVADGANYDFNSPEVWARTVLVNWNGGDVNDPTFPANVDAIIPEEGTIFRTITRKPATINDKFAFTAPEGASSNSDLAKEDVENVTVYPNPYYAGHSRETDRFDRKVTFYHLPEVATIRIFDLAGVQVRKLEKDDKTQFLNWDLLNESGLPVASGMYIAHVDMPDQGVTKVLKMMIIQRAEILQFY
jgi:hypothetical protein